MIHPIQSLAFATLVWSAFAAQDSHPRDVMVRDILTAWRGELIPVRNGEKPMPEKMKKFMFTVRSVTATKTAWKVLWKSVTKCEKGQKLENPAELFPNLHLLMLEFEEEYSYLQRGEKLFQNNKVNFEEDPEMVYRWNQWLLNITEAVRTDMMLILQRYPHFLQAVNGMVREIKPILETAQMSAENYTLCLHHTNSYIVSCLYETVFCIAIQLASNKEFRHASTKLWVVANFATRGGPNEVLRVKHERSNPQFLDDYLLLCHKMLAIDLGTTGTIQTIGHLDQEELLINTTLPCIRGEQPSFLSQQLQSKLLQTYLRRDRHRSTAKTTLSIRSIQSTGEPRVCKIGIAEKKGGKRHSWTKRCWKLHTGETDNPEILRYYQENGKGDPKGSICTSDLKGISFTESPAKIKKRGHREILNLHTRDDSQHEGRTFTLKFPTAEEKNCFWGTLRVLSEHCESLHRAEEDKQKELRRARLEAWHEKNSAEPACPASPIPGRVSAASGGASAERDPDASEPRKCRSQIQRLSDEEVLNSDWEQLVPYAKKVGVKIPNMKLCGELQTLILKKHASGRRRHSLHRRLLRLKM